MYSSWLPQNIQKRLLLYILQQLSLFSEVDLPNLEEVSINNIHLRSVSIDPEKFDKIPGFRLRHGTIQDFSLTGGVVDGINIDITGVDLVVAPSFDNIKQDLKDVETSLAQSTAELSSVILDDSALSDGESSPQGELYQSLSESNRGEAPPQDAQRRPSYSGGMMTKALDMALSRIRVSVKDVNIKVVIDSIDLELGVEKITFDSKNGLKSFSFLGVSASAQGPKVSSGNTCFNPATPESSSSDSDSTSDSDTELDNADLMESKVFTQEEASSIYMSAVSSSFEKPIPKESKQFPRNRAVLFFIDQIDASLESFFPFTDLRLEVNRINVAMASLVPTLLDIIGSLSKTVRLKNHQLRKMNFAQRESRFQKESFDNGAVNGNTSESTHRVFDAIKINSFTVGVTSSLTLQGNFASRNDDIELFFQNLTIKQKGNDLFYGGIESLVALKFKDGAESKLFHFVKSIPSDIPTDIQASSSSKSDVRFEFSIKKDKSLTHEHDTELTVLINKPGKFESDALSLQHLVSLLVALNSLTQDFSTLIRDLRLMSELINDARFTKQPSGIHRNSSSKQSANSGSQILLQTASIEINLILSTNTALKTTIYPISFDKLKDNLHLNRVISTYIIHGKEIHVMTLPRTILRFEPRDFEAFKFSSSKEVPDKTFLTTAISIQMGDIEISIDQKNFEALIADAKAFLATLELRRNFVSHSEGSSKMSSPEEQRRFYTKSMMISSTRSLRGNNGQIKFGEVEAPKANFKISIKSIHVNITEIMTSMGDIDIEIFDFMLYQHDTGNVGQVSSVSVNRFSNEKKLVIISTCLNEEYPMIQFSLLKNRPAPEVVFRRFQIDYYTSLLQSIQDLKQATGSDSASTQNKLEKRNDSPKLSTNLPHTKGEGGSFEVHCTSYNLMLGISPLRLPTKLNCGITKGTMYIKSNRGDLSLRHTFRDVEVLLMDEISNFRVPSTIKDSRFTSKLISGGYLSLGTISTLHLGLNIPSHIQETSTKTSNETSAVEVKINVDNVRASLCADSCHTLLQTVGDLKVPVTFSDKDKYNVNVGPGFEWPENILEEFQNFGGKNTQPRQNRSSSNARSLRSVADESLNFVDEYCDTTTSEMLASSTSIKSNSEAVLNQETAGNSSSLEFTEGHFYQKEKDSEYFPISMNLKVHVSKVEIFLHDGYDWKSTRKSLADSIKSLKKRAAEAKNRNQRKDADWNTNSESAPDANSSAPDANSPAPEPCGATEVSDTLFQSIHISADINADEANLVELINCRLQGDTVKSAHTNVDVMGRIKDLKLKRSVAHKIKIEVRNLNADYTNCTSRDPRFDDTPQNLTVEMLNKIAFRVEDLTIFDNVTTSSWNKFLTYMSILGDRELGMGMINLDMINVRPDAKLAFAETLIKLKILPLRLYIDQDTLGFLTRFCEFKDTRFAQPEEEPIFIQRLEIDALRLKFDYKPKKVDFSGIRDGNNAALVNFFAFDGSDLSLEKAVVYGVRGFAKVGEALGQVYGPNIRKSQIAGLLAGLPPVKSMLNFKSSVKDLVAIPLEEYKRDGRLLYGLQKGTKSFAKTTSSELLRLGVKIASRTQVILENSEEYFGGEGTTARRHVMPKSKKTPSTLPRAKNTKKNLLETSQILKNAVSVDSEPNVKPRRYLQASIDEEGHSDMEQEQQEFDANLGSDLGDIHSSVLLLEDSDESPILSDSEYEQLAEESQGKVTSLYSNQPANSGEGLRSAYASMGKNLSKTKRKLVDLRDELRQADSYQEQLTSIAKSSPVIIIRPIIGTTEAVMKTLMGVSNGIDSRGLVENHDKYRSEESLHDG